MQLQKIKQGYIVLLSTIILSVVGSIIILSLYNEQISNTLISSLYINKNKAEFLATTCTEQAMYFISVASSTIITNQRLDLNGGYCLFTIFNEGLNKRILSEGNINNVTKKTSTLIDINNLSPNNKIKILSWQEI